MLICIGLLPVLCLSHASPSMLNGICNLGNCSCSSTQPGLCWLSLPCCLTLGCIKVNSGWDPRVAPIEQLEWRFPDALILMRVDGKLTERQVL